MCPFYVLADTFLKSHGQAQALQMQSDSWKDLLSNEPCLILERDWDHKSSYTTGPRDLPYAFCLPLLKVQIINGMSLSVAIGMDLLNISSGDSHHHNICTLIIQNNGAWLGQINNLLRCDAVSWLSCRYWWTCPYTWDLDSATNSSRMNVITPHGHMPARIPKHAGPHSLDGKEIVAFLTSSSVV